LGDNHRNEVYRHGESAVAGPTQDGSPRAPNHPFHNEHGLVVVFSVNGTNLTEVAEARVGKWLVAPWMLLREVARRLCLFLICALPWAVSGDDAKPVTTILLVARAELPDSNFKDSVVLVMNNIGPAPTGVIVNRPTRIAVSRLFPEFEHLAQVYDKVYFGGPVELAFVSFLFRADAAPENATRVLDGVYFSSSGEVLHKLLGRDKPMEGLRIFIGHAGWAPGQLEAEIARGDWALAPAASDAIFGGKSEHPWPQPQPPDDMHRI